MPSASAIDAVEQVRIADDPSGRSLLIDAGPVDLPVGNDSLGEHAGHQFLTGLLTIPVGGWVQGFRFEVVDGAGRRVPSQVVHHVNLVLPDKRELFSPIMQRLMAAGEETSDVRLPWILGVPIRKGDPLLVKIMLHNPTASRLQGVRVRMFISYKAEDSWIGALRVHPFYLDVMPPAGDHTYDLPPGKSQKSWEGSPAVSGRVLAIGGHLHKHGIALRLEDVTTGELIWEARPMLDESGRVVGMPRDSFLFGKKLEKSHVYRVTAIYDNPTGRPIIRGAMGAIGGLFLPSTGEEWPAVDRRNPEFLTDWRITAEGQLDKGHMAKHAGHAGHAGG